LIEGIYRLMQSDEHEPTNIGNPQEMTILEFAERIHTLLVRQSPSFSSPCLRTIPSSAARTFRKRAAYWAGNLK